MSVYLIVTNNDRVKEKHQGFCSVCLLEGTYLEVLEKTRDYIHQGAKLLSHPMAGSLKPNQTPFRSVLLQWEGLEQSCPLHMESLRLIENSLEKAHIFLRGRETPIWPPHIVEDFKTVDLSIIDSAINKL